MPLVLAATPIGDPRDASPRLREALGTADVVAAEDTRRLRRLVRSLDVTVSGRVVALYDAVEQDRTAGLLDDLTAGRTVLVVSDAGMPLVSDPGYRLVRAAIDADVDVTVVPGPSAVTAAVAVAGLPVDRFCFEGFLPRRTAERRTRLRQLAADPRALVAFEAPHRLGASLADLAAEFGGDRRAAVCRELTKTYEQVRRGTLDELAGWAGATRVRGEITLVVEGAPRGRDAAPDADTLAAEVTRRVAAGASRRDAVAAVASAYGLSRRLVYDAAHRG